MRPKSKCYIYTRVSTAIQVDGYSLEAQKDKLRKYAEFQDYMIAGEYSDEGFSGKNIQGRLDFQRMLQDIQDRKDDVDYVLVFKLSLSTKSRLETQMDTLDVSDPHYERKIIDLQRRYDDQYDKMPRRSCR